MLKYLILPLCLFCILRTDGYCQTPRLEIHHIGAGDGDGTLIIAIDTVLQRNINGQLYLDTAIVLIDGQRSSGGKEIWRYIQDTLNALSINLKKINNIIISHLHIDHYGGIPYIVSHAKQANWKIGKVIDRQQAVYVNFISPLSVRDSCYGNLSAENPDAAAFKKYNDTLKKYNLYPTTALNLGDDLFPQFRNISMICVVAYGLTSSAIDPDNDTCFLPQVNIDGMNYFSPKSENDMSIGFIIKFQGFTYLTSGDLGGVKAGNYIDGETPLTRALLADFNYPADYHICAAKVSHHGSAESSTTWFAATNNFTLSVFPACLRSYGSSSNALPTETAITNLKSTNADSLRYTFVPNDPEDPESYWTKGNLDMYNDVIIKVLGAPGKGQNVSMQVIQRPKTKQGVYVGAGTIETIVCNKGHNW